MIPYSQAFLFVVSNAISITLLTEFTCGNSRNLDLMLSNIHDYSALHLDG